MYVCVFISSQCTTPRDNIEQSNGTFKVNTMNARVFLSVGELVYFDDSIVEGRAVHQRRKKQTYVVYEISHHLDEMFRAELARARSIRASLALAVEWSPIKVTICLHQPTWHDYWRSGRAVAAACAAPDPDNIDTLRAWAAAFILLGIASHLHRDEDLCRYCWRHVVPGSHYCREHMQNDLTQGANRRAKRLFSLLQVGEPELMRLYLRLMSLVNHGLTNKLTGHALSPFAEPDPTGWRAELKNLLYRTPGVARLLGNGIHHAPGWRAAREILYRKLDPDNNSGSWSMWKLKLPLAEKWLSYDAPSGARPAGKRAAARRAALRGSYGPGPRSQAWKVAKLLSKRKNKNLTRAQIARKLCISRAAVTKLFRTHQAFFAKRRIAIPAGR